MKYWNKCKNREFDDEGLVNLVELTLLANALCVGFWDMSFVLTAEPYIANGGCLSSGVPCLDGWRPTADAERTRPEEMIF